MQQELFESLQGLRGKECWNFGGGPGTGSMMTLDFGKKALWPVNSIKTGLTPAKQRFRGEISVYVQFAAWRLESKSAVVCSSTSSNHEGGPMQTGMAQVVGRRVQTVELSHPGLDLTIEFEGGLWLRVFCDQTNTEDESDNYSVHLQDRVYSVGIFSRVECEKHAPPRSSVK